MSVLYLNQEALMLLAQLFVISIYLIYFIRLPHKSLLTRQITNLTGAGVLALAAIGFTLLLPRPHPHLELAELWMFLAVLCGIHFALPLLYTYPAPVSPLPRELAWLTRISSVVSGLTILAVVIASGWGMVGPVALLSRLVGLLTVLYIVAGLLILARRLHYQVRSGPPAVLVPFAGYTAASWSNALNFIVVLALIVLPIVGNLLRGSYPLPLFFERIDILAATGAIFMIGIVLIGRIPEAITIMIKLIGIGLLTVVIMWSSLVLLVAPTIEKAYRPPHLIESQQHFRLVPDAAGAYALTAQPYRFDANWGAALPLVNEQVALPSLPFPFPFYGQSYQQLFVAADGFISLGQPPSFRTFSNHRQPTIAPLYMNLDLDQQGKIFYKADSAAVTVTWQAVPEAVTRLLNTFQVHLYPDGTIDFVYGEIHPRAPDGSVATSGLWLVGILPGNGTALTQQARFVRGARQSGLPQRALLENSDLDFRHYLHRQMIPIAATLFGVMIAVVAGFPLLFRTTLIAPLRTLLEGVEAVDRGQRTVLLMPTFNDEIGRVTHSFNQMVQSINASQAELHELNLTLEARVLRRTEELAQAKEAAEAANRAKSHFLATMSHELRTPLNAILGYAYLLQQGRVAAKGARIIEESGQHLLTLINDLLDIAKIEAGKLDLQKEWLSLPLFLLQLREMFQARAEAKGLVLHYIVAPALPQTVYVDERRLRQILINLLDNAVKFTETGSVTLHLQDEQAPSDQGHAQSVCHCRFTVTDTGSGIAADKLDLIFQPFEQVDIAQGPAIGTGLGLAISRRLVELMGGHLTVVSQLGVGSTFGFDLHLPIHSGPANVVTPRQVIGVKGPAPTVLIVDDNQYNRALLVDFLVPLGFPVLEAADGDAAMQVMYAQQPSIVLVDLVMPVMDGFAFIRDVRADRALAHLVLIAVSASVVGDEAQTSLQIGSNAFLRKPIEFAHLIKVLEQQAHIEWIEAPDRPLLSTATAPTQAPLSAHLSAEQRAVLLAAAQKGDIVALRTAVEQLVQSNSVALQHEGAALQALVETFQIQKVVQRLTS